MTTRKPVLPRIGLVLDLKAAQYDPLAKKELSAARTALRYVRKRFEGYSACPWRGCGHLQCAIVRSLARLDKLTRRTP